MFQQEAGKCKVQFVLLINLPFVLMSQCDEREWGSSRRVREMYVKCMFQYIYFAIKPLNQIVEKNPCLLHSIKYFCLVTRTGKETRIIDQSTVLEGEGSG